ncbi:MAG: hypothetical protein K2F72_05370, partial [Muribaculaceae bacterium]|nr:hypothetical protein [Muribaculaceae bacterium]
MAIFLYSLASFTHPTAAMLLMGIFGAVTMVRYIRKKYKKPLVWTQRARRIYVAGAVLCLLIGFAAMMIFGGDILERRLYSVAAAFTACYCASHIILMAANLLLRPVEKHINQGYINDARSRLASMPDLRVVGVTGSYGKTSTKHFLHRILSEQFDTLMTPGSFNTTLGVVRTIREYLKPYNEVFIVEMVAKNPGDIREICDLVHPEIGIVTAVGPQHLESFGSIENVQATKFELVDALPESGAAFVNDDFEMIASREVSNVQCLRYTCRDERGAQWQAVNIVYTPSGTDFEVKGPEGFSIQLHTRLLGEANISDLLAAVAVAVYMGVGADRIRYAVAQIEPVEHRLSVKRTA